MESKSLRRLDLVLGSFHSALRKTEDQTERYLGAIHHPHLHILGHPRGRIYNYRLRLTADWSRVFAEAARLDKAVEIDSYPDRQDLNLRLLRIAKTEGVRISLGSDAHHATQFGFIEIGLAAALKAQIPFRAHGQFFATRRAPALGQERISLRRTTKPVRQSSEGSIIPSS